VDNPALLHQFAQALARRYAEMFPAARGFVLELKENMMGKTFRGWEVVILHGFFSGVQILISPDRQTPQLIAVKVTDHSRLQQTLTKIAGILAVVLTAPVFIAGLLRGRIIFGIIVGLPVLAVLVVVLALIVHLICYLFKPLDHYFDKSTHSRILAIAGEIPLPTTLDRSGFPTPPPPPPAATPIPAFPTRRGPFGIKS
jgi:hypothetical protein